MARGMMRIHACAQDGDVEGVARELAEGVAVDARDPESGRTPLMEAVAGGGDPLGVVRLLVARGANVNASEVPVEDPMQQCSQLLDDHPELTIESPSGWKQRPFCSGIVRRNHRGRTC
jgi:hypothetical protein